MIRKQGKRTAAEAQHTKMEILICAAKLFCEHGFNHVSIRAIAEDAGVTHGLVRHYFGNKDQIWVEITDGIRHFMTLYIHKLDESICKTNPVNQRLYDISMRLMAFVLLHPQLMQIMIDFLHRDEANVDEFECNSEVFRQFAQKYVDEANEKGFEFKQEKLAWQFMMYAGGAVTFRPILKSRLGGSDVNRGLLQHWYLYEEVLAQYLVVNLESRCKPDSLEELVIHFECDEKLKSLFN